MKIITALAIAATSASASCPTLVYTEDFESHINLGNWEMAFLLRNETPYGWLYGPFGWAANDSTNTVGTYATFDLPDDDYTVTFDVWFIDSWEGQTDGDSFFVTINGTDVVFDEIVDNYDIGSMFQPPEAVGEFWGDITIPDTRYRVTVTHSGPITQIDWQATIVNWPNFDVEEAFFLDNVTISQGIVCPSIANLDSDCDVDTDDVYTFVDLFLTNDIRADFNDSGDVTFDDIDAFVSAFLAGCI